MKETSWFLVPASKCFPASVPAAWPGDTMQSQENDGQLKGRCRGVRRVLGVVLNNFISSWTKLRRVIFNSRQTRNRHLSDMEKTCKDLDIILPTQLEVAPTTTLDTSEASTVSDSQVI